MVQGSEWDPVRAERVKKGERERGFKVWKEDLFGTGAVLRRKREERDHWGHGPGRRVLFETIEERIRSGMKSEFAVGEDGVVEEYLKDEKQPWETLS
jgi:hypothetical protein